MEAGLVERTREALENRSSMWEQEAGGDGLVGMEDVCGSEEGKEWARLLSPSHIYYEANSEMKWAV